MSPSPRRGFALLLVLTATTLAMVMGAFAHHVAIGEQRRAGGRRDIAAASAAADAGAFAILRDWTGFDFDSLAVGDSLPAHTRRAGSATVVLRGLRTSLATWLVTTVAWFPDSVLPSAAVRRASLAVRLDLPAVGEVAALTTRRDVSVATGGEVSGSDSTSSLLSPGCAPSPSPVAGIAMPDTTRFSGGGRVTGIPPLREDPGAGTMATYDTFGGETWASLVARATVVLPAGSVVTPAAAINGGRCDASRPSNWGSPQVPGPCQRHAPVIHARGSIELRGGTGQGTLLVDGDLTLSSGATFHGVVIARDDVIGGLGGGVVLGAVLAADTAAAPGDHSQVASGVRIERASCVVRGVLARHARVIPVRERAWAPM